jgi:6-phosphogluconolactonase
MLKFDPTGRFVLATDLGLDRIFIYHLDGEHGRLTLHTPGEVVMPPASGPRHFVFHPNGRFLYLANELDSTVTACEWDGEAGRLRPFQKLPTLPGGYEGVNAVADIHLHPSGRFLYVSNRGHDSLAIFSVDHRRGLLDPLGHAPSGGRTPRGFAIDPQGQFILVANQHSGNIAALRLDPQSGQLFPTDHKISIPQPVCVLFYY